MNEFLEQFLIEARELIEQATDDLLALEEDPADAERLGGAFRAFHTLKGAAGIMEFTAMARALHAAEDVLAAARAGEEPVTPALISDALTCLDQVVQWLDATEASGETPVNADAEADAIVRRFVRVAALDPVAEPQEDRWAQALLSGAPDAAARAELAVRYIPHPDAFLDGEDPVALFRDEPGLLTLAFSPAGAWPDLADFDAFRAQLVITALIASPTAAFRERIAALGEQVDSVELTPQPAPALAGPAGELLQGQLEMLAGAAGDGAAGRAGSAAIVVANVLRRSGRADEADRMASLAAGAAPAVVADAIRQVISGAWAPAPAESHEPEIDPKATPEAMARSLRVDVERVDALVNLTGELTIATNALAHVSAMAAEGDVEAVARALRGQHGDLERLVRELQRAVLNLRVLPLRQVFQRFPRLVREMVVSLEKPARLLTEGEATEADKTIVEALFEPLLHVLRNALDHGVESAEVRAAAGKPPSATITLRARSEGDQVIVEVEDDGGGIDVARVREIAARRELMPADELAALSDVEVADLIFAPGFSTARTVTTISGRGVGMDAVRTAVERLGGRVSLHSEAGLGTIVRFTLPFSVMMSRVMTVEAGDQVFGIPMEAVLETVRLPRDRIVGVGTAQAFVLRDRTVPVIDLAQTLGRARPATPRAQANLVVATAGGRIAGLEVDRLGDRMDVMLKPLQGLLAGTPGVAGATLLGDGRVLLVLDLQELLQ